MNFRCSNSVAALALLIGSGGGVLFAPEAGAGEAIDFTAAPPAARAGQRIEFSAPAIPLAVPQPEVEVSEPTQYFTPPDSAAGPTDEDDMGRSDVVIVRPRARGQSAWDADPLKDSDPNQPNAGDWLTRPQPQPLLRLTNNNDLNMQRDSDAESDGSLLRRKFDSGLDPGLNTFRPGQQNPFDKEAGREGDGHLFGREFPGDNEGSLWKKAFVRDASGTERFNTARFMPYMDEYRNFGGGAPEDQINHPTPGAGLAHSSELPPDDGSPISPEESQSRQNEEETGAGLRDYRAWDSPSSTRPALSKRSSNPAQLNPSRGQAPVRPAILEMPIRPGVPH